MPILMDFDPKQRERLSSSSHPSLFFHDNFPKSRDEFSLLEGGSSSKDTSFLQDIHPFESFNLNGSSSSSNPIFALQPTTYLDPFDNSSLEGLQNFDFYESKPLGNINNGGINNNNGSLIPLLDNFNNNQSGVGVLGHSQMVTPISMINNPSFQSHNHFNYYNLGPTKYLPADEGSCTTLKKDLAIATKSLTMVKKGGRGRKKKPNVVKGQWTIEEDRLLVQLVERYGVRKWSQIAQMLNGRIGKQCRERWHNHLRPDIKKDVWSEEEDRILIEAHAEIGNKWAEIAKRLPGRTENSIKNHWNATKRRQFSRRKCRSKYPRQSSLLQDYIKSLAPEIINAGCRKKPSSSTSTTRKSSNKSSKTQIGSSDNNSISTEDLNPDYDFSEVPDFNFDAQMFEDSSFDSLLEDPSNTNEQNDNAIVVYDHPQGGRNSSENLNDVEIDLGSMMQQCEVKKELDLVEMINQVNL